MLKGLLEKRAAKVAEMRSINESAKNREEQRMTAEEAERFDACEKEIADLDKEIHRAEVMEQEDMRNAQQRAAASTTKVDAATEQKRAFFEYLRSGNVAEEHRAALTPDNSGAIIPKEISQKIILGVQGQFDLMKHVDLRITPHAKTFMEPILSGNPSLTRITVGGNNTEDTAAFDGIEIKAYDYRLGTIPVSRTLLEGTDIDVENALVALFTEHIARGLTSLMTTAGTSSEGITAFVPNIPTTVSAAAGAISYNDLVDLLAKVKAPHSAQGVASWVMNSTTRAALMKVLDEMGRPIFMASAIEGEPDRILGRPVVIDDSMPDISANKVPIVFGDLKKYVLRIVQGVKVYTYMEEKYQKDNCIGLQAFVTADGKLLSKSGSVEPLAGLKMKAS